MRFEKFLVLTVLAVLFTASVGFSNSANCYTLLSDTGTITKTATIGVASNLWGPVTDANNVNSSNISLSPALTMVQNYLADQTGTSITTCHDSTTALVADRASYSMIFGADSSMITNGYSLPAPYAPFVYAKGIPTFFRVKSGSMTANDLITPPSTVTWTTANEAIAVDNTGNISSYTVNSDLIYDSGVAIPGVVSVASTAAPYGVSGQAILHDMDGVNFNPVSSIPAWIYQLSPPSSSYTLWPNIAQTYDSVVGSSVVIGANTYTTTSVVAGFVAKSQLCSNLSSYVTVDFISPTYTLEQAVGILSTASGTGLDVAKDLYDYIQDEIDDHAWGPFLSSFCYLAP